MDPLLRLIRRRLFWLSLLLLVWLLCSGQAQAGGQAGKLSDRLQAYPHWTDRPPVQTAIGDLAYPDWMAGTWTLASTLVDAAAPLAPTITTPGFEGNQALLNQPVACQVRFVPSRATTGQWLPAVSRDTQLVSDRAFNGLNLARAYLGDDTVKAVRVDPQNPNRQITVLKGDRQLESTVTGRATEVPDPQIFITSEVFLQTFRGTVQPYFNEVETTTAYYHHPDQASPITADQVTAIYLSPQDPDYFKAPHQPVALYRYQLEFSVSND